MALITRMLSLRIIVKSLLCSYLLLFSHAPRSGVTPFFALAATTAPDKIFEGLVQNQRAEAVSPEPEAFFENRASLDATANKKGKQTTIPCAGPSKIHSHSPPVNPVDAYDSEKINNFNRNPNPSTASSSATSHESYTWGDQFSPTAHTMSQGISYGEPGKILNEEWQWNLHAVDYLQLQYVPFRHYYYAPGPVDPIQTQPSYYEHETPHFHNLIENLPLARKNLHDIKAKFVPFEPESRKTSATLPSKPVQTQESGKQRSGEPTSSSPVLPATHSTPEIPQNTSPLGSALTEETKISPGHKVSDENIGNKVSDENIGNSSEEFKTDVPVFKHDEETESSVNKAQDSETVKLHLSHPDFFETSIQMEPNENLNEGSREENTHQIGTFQPAVIEDTGKGGSVKLDHSTTTQDSIGFKGTESLRRIVEQNPPRTGDLSTQISKDKTLFAKKEGALERRPGEKKPIDPKLNPSQKSSLKETIQISVTPLSSENSGNKKSEGIREKSIKNKDLFENLIDYKTKNRFETLSQNTPDQEAKIKTSPTFPTKELNPDINLEKMIESEFKDAGSQQAALAVSVGKAKHSPKILKSDQIISKDAVFSSKLRDGGKRFQQFNATPKNKNVSVKDIIPEKDNHEGFRPETLETPLEKTRANKKDEKHRASSSLTAFKSKTGAIKVEGKLNALMQKVALQPQKDQLIQKVVSSDDGKPSSNIIEALETINPKVDIGKLHPHNEVQKSTDTSRGTGKDNENLGCSIEYERMQQTLSKPALKNFQLLSHALRVQKKGWDFAIDCDFHELPKRDQTKLEILIQSKSEAISHQIEFLTREIGFPEGERRIRALKRQLDEESILDKWEAVTKFYINSGRLTKETVEMVRRILEFDKLWPTFLKVNRQDLSSLKELNDKNDSLKNMLRDISVGAGPARLENFFVMASRWNPHDWLEENEIKQILRQALDLNKIVLVGDCLQFGRLSMTEVHSMGLKPPKAAFSLMFQAWNRSGQVPWHLTAERAWLTTNPRTSELYASRLRRLKELLSTVECQNQLLISLLDDEKKNQIDSDPWWHLGHILIWQDQGLSSFMMANLGTKMNLKKNQNLSSSISYLEQTVLENTNGNSPEKINQALQWFNEEFGQSIEIKSRPSFLNTWLLNKSADLKTYVKWKQKQNGVNVTEMLRGFLLVGIFNLVMWYLLVD